MLSSLRCAIGIGIAERSGSEAPVQVAAYKEQAESLIRTEHELRLQLKERS